jgi:16S rRNA (adenine1518-N6/adenine1519-N6)-dimethyltransferase
MNRLSLKKSLGQHHLREGALCRPLLRFLSPERQRVLEIGPGGGILTRELLAAGARVIGWELDLEWAAELRRRLPEPTLAIAVADALEIPWDRLPAPTLVAGNLPYNVATVIIERLLPHHLRVPRAAFLVQKEVGDRLAAVAGDEAYGALSVLVSCYSRVTMLGQVKRGSFQPPPKVDGAFVGFELHPPPVPEGEMKDLTALVRLAFSQRRKTLRNALASGWGRERTAAVLAAIGLDDRVRAEALGLTEFLGLHYARLDAELAPNS